MPHRLVIAVAAVLALAAKDAPRSSPSKGAQPGYAAPAALPPGPLGETVKLGKVLFEQTGTHPLTKAYVANALSCASCHPDAGAHPSGATLLGAAGAYPAYSPRERAVITLEDRVLNCFMRSMSGVRPPNGSVPSVAITAYLTWLSTGTEIHENPKAPLGPRSYPKIAVDPAKASVTRGKDVYARRCATCHGADGQGEPPVWGPRSYNAGAGLADVSKLAGWVHVTMPPEEKPLAEQEAVDVAAFIDAQPRPDFVLVDHLPPAARSGQYNATVMDEVVRAPTWPPRR